MDKTEGGYLQRFLKKNKIKQEALAAKMGMSRQGLRYHFAKEKVDYEFKMKLREHGVNAFDENGKLNLPSETPNKVEESPATYDAPPGTAYTLELSRKLIATYEEQIGLQRDIIRLQKEEIENLKKKLGKT